MRAEFNKIMDLVSIGVSAILSAALFIILEFSVILPLFKKIVTSSVNDMVTKDLIPSVNAYIDEKIKGLTTDLTGSLFRKFRAYLGGSKKGVNSILARLAEGEDLEDMEDQYEPSTIDKVYSIVSAVAPYLPDPSQRGKKNGKEESKEENEQAQSVQRSASPFEQAQIQRFE